MIRYNHVTSAPGWLIREKRMHNGRTLITLQDALGNKHGSLTSCASRSWGGTQNFGKTRELKAKSLKNRFGRI